MFENPPAWTIPLANLTDWFEWPAVGAILTALVLWNTVRLANRANRAERRKEALLVYAAGRELDYAVTAYESLVRTVNKGVVPFIDIEAALEWYGEHGFYERLKSFDMNSLPTIFAYRRFNHGRHNLSLCSSQLRGATKSKKLPDLLEFTEAVANVQQSRARLHDHAQSMVSRRDWARIQSHTSTPKVELARSLKSLPASLRTVWTGLPFAGRRLPLSTDKDA